MVKHEPVGPDAALTLALRLINGLSHILVEQAA